MTQDELINILAEWLWQRNCELAPVERGKYTPTNIRREQAKEVLAFIQEAGYVKLGEVKKERAQFQTAFTEETE